ncbi:MAG: hypothetical protein KJZ73_00050 [Pseudorhodoplanes sp.]|nr:hypothetical protein [Pseudorhodoplanes sp.]
MAMKKVALGSRWLSATDVIDRLKQARENREQQSKLLASLEAQAAQRREEVERSLADLPQPQRGQIVARTVNGHRNELKRQSTDARRAHLKEAGRLLEQTDGARPHYQSAVGMLMREGLGSERRSRLLQQIAHSGPVELASLAEFAAATKDKELGAALCTRVSDLAPNERPFSSRELADALVGEEHRRVTAALMELDRLTQEAAHADSAFERGAANPVRSIRIARMKQAEAAVGADLANLDDTEDEEE